MVRLILFWVISVLIVFRGVLELLPIGLAAKIVIEFLIIFWFLLELSKGRLVFLRAGLKSTSFYVLWILCIGVLHHELPEVYIYLRYTLLGLFILHIFYSLSQESHIDKVVLKSVDCIVVMQIIASIISFVTLGRLERIVGTMSVSGGSLATVWPLMFAPFYYFRYIYTGKKRNLLVVLGLLFMGYCSGKRAVYFLVPTSIILINLFFKQKGSNQLTLVSSRNIFSIVILLLGLMAGISGTDSLSQSNGFSLSAVNSAFSYVGEYSTAVSVLDGSSIGRTSATKSAFEYMLSGNMFFVGNGLSTLKGEISYLPAGIGYGITGLIREFISAGIIGALSYLSIYLTLLYNLWKKRSYVHSNNVDTEGLFLWYLSVAGLISLLVTTFGYSRVFTQSFAPLFFVMITVGLSLRWRS